MDYEIKRFTLEEARELIDWYCIDDLSHTDQVVYELSTRGLPIITKRGQGVPIEYPQTADSAYIDQDILDHILYDLRGQWTDKHIIDYLDR